MGQKKERGKAKVIHFAHTKEQTEALYCRAVTGSAAYKRLKNRIAALKDHDETILRYHITSPWKKVNLTKVKIRFLETADFVIRNAPDIHESSTLEIGASSTIVTDLINLKTAIFSDLSANHCRNTHPSACADASLLSIKPNSVDYILSFQCLEHTPNPGAMLHEISRCIRKGAFISIPYRKTTRVIPRTNGNPFSQHIIEFSEKDFITYAKHFNLETKAQAHISPYKEYPLWHLNHWQYKRWGWTNPSVVVFYLAPRKEE